MIRFAHLSDCHIGGWREEKLRALSIASFDAVVQACLAEHVDFVVIAGDLFNTSVPSIDALKMVASGLKRLHEQGIRVYVIPGSHDYSPSGKTMLEVLEKSGLCRIVFRFDREHCRLEFTVDDKTGVKLAGMPGLRGGLEKFDYMKLDKMNLEKEDGLKIFLFHSLITEFKPAHFEMVDSEPLMSLPRHFSYYAGGHPHFVFQKDLCDEGYGVMAYPGPLFPNNFQELENLRYGGFFVVEMSEDGRCVAKHVPLLLKPVVSVVVDVNGKSVESVNKELEAALRDERVNGALVTVRVEGCLATGKTTDIRFRELFDRCAAYMVLKNTYKLTTKELAEVKVRSCSVEEIEEQVLLEYVRQRPVSFLGLKDGMELARVVMRVLDKEKLEGERVSDFEERVISDMVKELGLSEVWDAA